MTEIRVAPQFLRNLAGRILTVANDLQRCSDRGEQHLTSAPDVEDAYQKLGHDWDFRRRQVVDVLSYLADSLIIAGQKFSEEDRQLANELDQISSD